MSKKLLICLGALFSILLSALLASCQGQAVIEPELDAFLHTVIMERNEGLYFQPENGFACEDHVILGSRCSQQTTTVYAWVLYEEFELQNGQPVECSGGHVPTAISVERQADGSYRLLEYWEPGDGSRYAPDIRAKFPVLLRKAGLDSQKYIGEQSARCKALAEDFFAAK